MNGERITFSFGQNWSDFVTEVTEKDVSRAKEDIKHWIGEQKVKGSRVVDVGSGSGIHSLSFQALGAASVYSFDFDPLSVEATRSLHTKIGSPQNWTVEPGSILDADYVEGLGTFDVVYSWGVLHHTGAMWRAIDNCIRLVKPDGLLWISLYKKGDRYPEDLKLKRKFNAAGPIGKRWMVMHRILRAMAIRARQGKNPFAWNQKVGRGMNVYHDIIDWLGGLPYETATEDEVVRFARERGFDLERIQAAPEGGCSVYVFSRRSQPDRVDDAKRDT